MIRCLFIKRKLYDYFDNSLSEIEQSKIKEHLDSCAGCRNNLKKIHEVIDTAGSKNIPHPTEEFWNKFQGELDDKLNDVLTPAYKPGFRERFSIKSVVLVPSVSVLVLVMAVSIQSNHRNSTDRFHQAMLDEMNVLEEVSPATTFNNGIEFSLDEAVLASEM
ncbi:MAG: zf-HC2 domain-containing protein [Candidatus Omnitrophota bacterium]|jgi:hypothetical protein